MAKVGIIGASGYTGAELLRLCHAHPELDVVWATGDSQAGTAVADLYPSLAAAYAGVSFAAFEQTMAEGIDLVFVALPHGASQQVVSGLLEAGCRVADLGADFRLQDPAAYDRWYGAAHTNPDLLRTFVYGLPELYRDRIVDARAVAVPGCYPTAAGLALAPLVRSGLVETTGIIVDAASGVSGAGRTLSHRTHFGTANEDFRAYGLLDHRHTPEIEQTLGATVLFTPHLAPMTRGILATSYARPTTDTDPLEVLEKTYAGEPFVVVSAEPPSTKATLGSNAVHLTARHDVRTGWIVALAALDNLVKGAAGQAVQCANLMLGLDETAGLTAIGLYP